MQFKITFMYRSNNKITNQIEDLVNYIDGVDIYNSLVVQELKNPGLTREPYEITTYQYRPDLIAREFYGSESYEGLVLLQTGLVLSNFTRGKVIQLIAKTELNNLLRKL